MILINRSFEKAQSIQRWRHLLVKLICMPILFLFLILIRLLRPLITIRLNSLDAAEIAPFVLLLSSSHASFATGSLVNIDGGAL